MAEQAILKKSLFGGFNKNDVLEYIDKMNENARQAEEQLTHRIDDLEEKNTFLAQQAHQLRETLEETQRYLAAETEKNRSLTEAKKQLESDLLNSRYSDEQHIRELELEREKNRQLELSLAALEEKAKRYDGINAQIGDILVEARLGSARMMDDTRLQCREAAEKANESIDGVIERINEFDDQLNHMRGQFATIMRALGEEMDSIQNQLEETATRLKDSELIVEDPEVTQPEEIVRAAEEEASSLFSKAAEAAGE